MTEIAPSRLKDICFDCARPAALSRFWAQALNYTLRPHSAEDLAALRARGIEDPDDDPNIVIDPPGAGPKIWFNRVPEPKTVKNRVHIDINLESADGIAWLERLGARVLRPVDAEPGEPWAIMADPEGNEFCAFPPRR